MGLAWEGCDTCTKFWLEKPEGKMTLEIPRHRYEDIKMHIK
jgi:hypothetical protein